MKIKTSELIGAALDWAVAKCEGMDNLRKNQHRFDPRLIMDGPEGNGVFLDSLNYSTNWAQGGPLLEGEGITVSKTAHGFWEAYKRPASLQEGYQVAGTPLIAAMRCLCCSTLGDEVEIPEELLALEKAKEEN